MIFNIFKDYLIRNNKKERELEFQKQWKDYKWEDILPSIADYWKCYRYFDEVMKIIQPKDKKILDVGSGVVSALNLICNYPGEYYGIDPLMDDYRNLYPLSSRVNWISSKGEIIPFDESFFDTVICSNVLDHVEKPNIVMQEIARVLKSSGKLLLTVDVFKEKVVRDAAHPHCFMEKDIINLLENQFSILFSRKSELSAQILLYVKKQTTISDNTQELIIVAEKKRM